MTSPMVQAVDEVKSIVLLDATGHLLCDFDEDGACECDQIAGRLIEHDKRVRAAERERVALAIEAAFSCNCTDSYCSVRNAFERTARIAREVPA